MPCSSCLRLSAATTGSGLSIFLGVIRLLLDAVCDMLLSEGLVFFCSSYWPCEVLIDSELLLLFMLLDFNEE